MINYNSKSNNLVAEINVMACLARRTENVYGAHPYMKLPAELANLLLSKLTTVVMQSNKTMVALYQTFVLQFMHAKHIHGR